MAKRRINAEALSAFLSAGESQAAAARHFGVSEAAVSLRVKQLKIATSKVVALERAAAVVDQQLSAADRLRHVQVVIQEQLTWAETSRTSGAFASETDRAIWLKMRLTDRCENYLS